ncbi:MAG TPA: GNAT family N-acetyltransferase [Gemmatimonadales bacterium]|jgi:hypothetical protein
MNDAAPIEVHHNIEASRFEVLQDGQLAELTYEDDGTRIAFLHTGVPLELEGQGIAAALARTGLDWARDHDRHVIPHCRFVRAYIARHPEYEELVG